MLERYVVYLKPGDLLPTAVVMEADAQATIAALQQRVAQLEQDSKKASTDYEACRNALDKTVGELTTLQADHATLLGLLATIAPYVASWLQETYGDDYVNHPEWKQVEASLPAPPAQDGGK